MTAIRLFLALLTLTLVGCNQTNQFTDSGLVYCSEGDPETFNPQLTVSGTDIDASAKQLFNRLVQQDPKTGAIVAELASDWKISADGRQYLFMLRQDVQFHHTPWFTPSRPMNADDVIFSFERWLQRGHPYHAQGGAKYPYFQSIGLDQANIRLVRVSDHQVRLELAEPRPNLLAELATDFAVILSQEYGMAQLTAGTPENFDNKPIGTGPFKLNQYQRNQFVRYLRHDQYWGQPAALQQLVFDITPTASARVIKLIGGDCDVAALPQISELDTIQQYDDLLVDMMPGLNVAFWAFNSQKPPFDNPKVRQALSLAVDKRRILQAVYYNTAANAKGMLPPISWAYNPSLPALEYDPVRARALLHEAAITDLTIDIWTTPEGRVYNPNGSNTAELIQQDLAKIGISARIISHDWYRFLELLATENYDSALVGWYADNLDPDNFYSPLLSCAAVPHQSNRAKWCSQQFDDLINQARQTENREQRRALYRQLEHHIQQQAPVMPLAHASRILARKRQWQGPIMPTSGGIDFSKVTKIQTINPTTPQEGQ
ncbi:ABC transporter substrate-binding protein [Ferrimonas senticii]|uniref:ABC transporter substrate-binding protein n=1 Tax=Ferrimonas senticii TaxID=394566 RepID=UPI0004050DE9|nr:ABC transporter substrate-binding protein [Ferrimonas senticii]